MRLQYAFSISFYWTDLQYYTDMILKEKNIVLDPDGPWLRIRAIWKKTEFQSFPPSPGSQY